MLGDSFYDEVMREIVLALGAAMFLAYGFALVRRRADARRAAAGHQTTDLVQAPVVRSVTFMLIGLVAAVWALASILTS